MGNPNICPTFYQHQLFPGPERPENGKLVCVTLTLTVCTNGVPVDGQQMDQAGNWKDKHMPTQATGRQIDIFIINKSEKLAGSTRKVGLGPVGPMLQFSTNCSCCSCCCCVWGNVASECQTNRQIIIIITMPLRYLQQAVGQLQAN